MLTHQGNSPFVSPHRGDELPQADEGLPLAYPTSGLLSLRAEDHLRLFRKLLNELDEEINSKRIPLTSEIKEDLETNFLGIIAIIRNFRNESGHPTGNIISREQCCVNLNLFIPYCKKMYQLMDFFNHAKFGFL
jgi:hypothetical protein